MPRFHGPPTHVGMNQMENTFSLVDVGRLTQETLVGAAKDSAA
jgi:hypothetical protein